MALTDESNGTNTTMLVQPTGWGGGNGFADGGFGGIWGIILLLLCLGNGMWGGFGGGMLPMMMGGMGMDGFGLYPWLNNSQNINGGFRDQALQSSISGLQNAVTAGFGDVQLGIAGVNQNICQTGNGIVAAVTGAQNALASQLYGNTIADMERSFAAQTASTAGMTALQAQLANCCCENRAATADLKYTVATENCADRTAAYQNTRDIIDNQNTKAQAIMDKLCSLELDGYKRENDNLRQQLNMASLAASQNAQTAAIQAGQRALANEVEQYVLPTPRPAYIVQNPNCCAPNFGCGCGVAA